MAVETDGAAVANLPERRQQLAVVEVAPVERLDRLREGFRADFRPACRDDEDLVHAVAQMWPIVLVAVDRQPMGKVEVRPDARVVNLLYYSKAVDEAFRPVAHLVTDGDPQAALGSQVAELAENLDRWFRAPLIAWGKSCEHQGDCQRSPLELVDRFHKPRIIGTSIRIHVDRRAQIEDRQPGLVERP